MYRKLLILGFILIVFSSIAIGEINSERSYTFANATFPSWMEGICLLSIVVVIVILVSIVVVIFYIAKAFGPKYEKSKSKEESGRHCKSCGKGIPEDARICPYCNREFWKI